MTTPRPASPPQDGTAALLGDGRTLADLLRMAGPEIAPTLLRQMQADLAAVRDSLAPALPDPAASAPAPTSPDWLTIRAQSHILISLAGTIGATRLHSLAVDLNAAAHARAAERVAALAPPLLADLAALTALIRSHPEATA